MKPHTILSITRKYVGIGLVIYGLLLIGSINASVTPTYTTSHSPVTFLTPHSVTAPRTSATDNAAAVANNTSTTPATPQPSTAQSSVAASTPAVVEPTLPAPSAPTPDQSVVPTEVYVPPADTEISLPPTYPCGSCRPTPTKSSPQIMCPQYMSCIY